QRNMAAGPPPARSTEVDSRPRIEVVHPRRVTVAQRLQTNATLAAFEKADLFAKVTGYLSDVRVDSGDHVKAGQILEVIDITKAGRACSAYPIVVAAATVENTKTLRAYSQIVAPFDAVVGRHRVNRGDLVQAPTGTLMTPLFTVQRIDTIRVFCDVPENDVPYL